LEAAASTLSSEIPADKVKGSCPLLSGVVLYCIFILHPAMVARGQTGWVELLVD
jgi:hypothetical protein